MRGTVSKKLWGGRFGKETHPLVEEFTRSIRFDYKLAPYDVLGSLAHVRILRRGGYLSAREATRLTKGLNGIYRDIITGTFTFDAACEDIHTNIQNALEKRVGGVALKLHTARSRNEQVACATRLYCKERLRDVIDEIDALRAVLKKVGEDHRGLIMPGFTHLQHAQPVFLKDHLGAWSAMLERDRARLSFIFGAIKITMGAGALAGTPIDASRYAGGGVQPTANSLDSVSDRDFVIESLSALAIIGMHLSRIAEDLIIWSTKEFDFVEIDESFCTGSSLMPQKKNPDVLELIRGYAGRLHGNLVSAFTMMKGLPLTYNRDMQLDKEPLFNSFEIVSSELKVLAGLMKTLKFNKEKIQAQLEDESLYATDLVYYLVDKGIAFKNAHTITGKLVKYSLDNNILIKKMTEPELKRFSDKFVKREIVKLFDPFVSVKSKKSIKRK